MTPLHHVGNLVRDTLQAIPLGAVRVLFVGLLVAVLIWVLRLPREQTTMPAEAGRSHTNLKWGAALALVLQILIYSLL